MLRETLNIVYCARRESLKIEKFEGEKSNEPTDLWKPNREHILNLFFVYTRYRSIQIVKFRLSTALLFQNFMKTSALKLGLGCK